MFAYRTYRIEIGGVVVRYVEDSYSIQVTVEGALPVETVAQLRSDVTAKLEALEQSPVAYRDIET